MWYFTRDTTCPRKGCDCAISVGMSKLLGSSEISLCGSSGVHALRSPTVLTWSSRTKRGCVPIVPNPICLTTPVLSWLTSELSIKLLEHRNTNKSYGPKRGPEDSQAPLVVEETLSGGQLVLGVSRHQRPCLGVFCKQDHRIFGSIQGPPHFWKHPLQKAGGLILRQLGPITRMQANSSVRHLSIPAWRVLGPTYQILRPLSTQVERT